MEGESVLCGIDDRQKYLCVCETKVEQKKSGIFMVFFRMYIVSFYFLPFHLNFYI